MSFASPTDTCGDIIGAKRGGFSRCRVQAAENSSIFQAIWLAFDFLVVPQVNLPLAAVEHLGIE